jgi:hypothetical protein
MQPSWTIDSSEQHVRQLGLRNYLVLNLVEWEDTSIVRPTVVDRVDVKGLVIISHMHTYGICIRHLLSLMFADMQPLLWIYL